MVLAGVSVRTDELLTAGFDRVAARHPSQLALFSENWQPTYSELRAATNRLAHALIARGIRPGDRVAIITAPDAATAAPMVAAWKAGAITVVFNGTHPVERLRQLVADCDPAALVVDADHIALAAEVIGSDGVVIRIEDHRAQGPAHDPEIWVSAAATAALVYTSGSTGRPNAVMMTHRQLRRQVEVHTEAMGYRLGDRIGIFGSFTTSTATTATCCALLNGATLCVFPVATKGITEVADWVVGSAITAIACQVSVFRNIMATLADGFQFDNVRAIRIGGEPATSGDFRLFRRHFPADSWMVLSFSASETGVVAWSSLSPSSHVEEGRLLPGPLTHPGEVVLLGDDDQPVKAGEIGEIVVRSRYVAAGYWRNPALSAERFSVEHDDGTRTVRSGDLGRIGADGLLEICGRTDDRIKIRGHRIELREVVEALTRLPGVDRATVEAIARNGREPVLTAFVSMSAGHTRSGTELRRALRRALPDYMTPSVIIVLDEWPLAPSGKVDREALRQLYRRRYADRPIEAPRTPTETLLVNIWAELFQLPDISRHDDFFDLGGDSLMAMMVAVRVHEAIGIELDLAMLIDHAELAALARFVDARRLVAAPPAGPRPRPAGKMNAPMSPWQERIWNDVQAPASSAKYMKGQIYCLEGPLDVELLRACMEEMVQRHEMLRTTFASRFGAVQIVHAAGPAPLPTIDLRDRQDPETEVRAIFEREAARPVDLRRGPLARFVLLRLRDNEYRLLRLSHHIICDAMSWSIYLKELAALYEGARTGGPPLPPPRLQYADYAIWQRQRLDPKTPDYRKVVAWWKDKLAGAPPSFKPPFRPPRRDYAPADSWAPWSVAPAVSQRLHRLGAQFHATRLMVRLAAFSALLAAAAGQPEVIIGLYVSLRRRAALADVFGYFTNLATLRLRPDFVGSFADWIATVREEVVAAQAHGEVPYDDLWRALRREGARPPAINVIFGSGRGSQTLTFADVSLIRLDVLNLVYRWGFSTRIDELGDDRTNISTFDPRLYDPADVRAFLDRYARLLDIASRDPDKPLGDLLAMSEPVLAAAQ